ncbi:MAG: hypothetical protein ACI3ZV_06785 [Paludibacteraceae bacterium]|nr:hypothetical protein [Bacteroidales bacterium]MCI7429916.1 hypothetical protein [Bacteroidales bacterium]MDD7528421.1 hypothetical protein [Bacteroidales bacterium]MDY4850237.1 hypothetical protein [Paludibacteraceae bacterium]
MEIKEYIKNAIFEIADGLSEVIKDQTKHKIVVNPCCVLGTHENLYVCAKPEQHPAIGRPVQILSFDMSVQTTEDNTTEIKGGSKIYILSASGGLEEHTSNMSENRLKFSIPICLPTSNSND